jgi:hypothetical protein
MLSLEFWSNFGLELIIESKSCTTNLFEALDYISFCFDKGIPVAVILLDYAKTFDIHG